jgi:hypothetical protein
LRLWRSRQTRGIKNAAQIVIIFYSNWSFHCSRSYNFYSLKSFKELQLSPSSPENSGFKILRCPKYLTIFLWSIWILRKNLKSRNHIKLVKEFRMRTVGNPAVIKASRFQHID